MTDAATKANVAALQKKLRAGAPRLLELLSADLLGRLLKVRVSVARGGFQHGGDAGTAGRRGRHLRIECKRYSDNTPLGDRDLQGEVDDALRHNPALEAWVLVSTRGVSDTTQDVLNLKARKVGVPILVIDWSRSGGAVPDLAALCGWAPDLVEAWYGKAAGSAARRLTSHSRTVVDRLRSELAPWRIGYRQLRRACEVRIRRLWNSDVESRAVLGQNAAGGASPYLVVREPVVAALDAWWKAGGQQLVVAYGGEGVGKTWAVLNWVLKRLRRLPMTLVLAASAFRGLKGDSEASVLEFLAAEVHDIAGSQDRLFWLERLRRLFEAPAGSTPMLLLVIDGVNQEPSFEWLRLIQVLQGGSFRGRVSVVLTTQTHYLEDRLYGLRTAAGGVRRIGVEPYEVTPGGELERLLADKGMSLADVPHDLLPLLRVPRLFPIAIKFSQEATIRGDVTPARLLWAHGRDDLSLREGRALSESEWESWLLGLAQSYLSDIETGNGLGAHGKTYCVQELEDMVARRSLEPSVNYRRLQEIVDGTWMEKVPGRPGQYRPKADTIHLALGAAVLRILEDAELEGEASVDATLASWLDPVASTSIAVDILASAMSIAVAKGLPPTSRVLAAVVAALLKSQNASDSHRQQVVALAPALVEPLLAAIELSSSRVQASARHWACVALRNVSTANKAAWDVIRGRLVHWVGRIVCPDPSAVDRGDDYATHMAERLRKRIGTAQPGPCPVMGAPVSLHVREPDDLAGVVPGLLLGTPLCEAMPVFATAAVASSISMGGSSVWDGLKWLIDLNPVDPELTQVRLRELSDAARLVQAEPDVHKELPARVQALLLWLAGSESCEHAASEIQVSFETGLDYDKDYLSNPTRSFFIGVEHRHLNLLWHDDALPVLARIQKAKRYLSDPTLRATDEFIQLLEAQADRIDVAKLDTNLSATEDDHAFEELAPGVARFAPTALGCVVQRWFDSLAVRAGEPRHWAALRAPWHILVADSAAASSAHQLRLSRGSPPDREEASLSARLLMIELLNAGLDEQLDALVSDPTAHLALDLIGVLRPPEPDVVRRFWQRWDTSNRRAAEVLLNYLAEHAVAIGEDEFQRLSPFAFPGTDPELRVLAFIALQRATGQRFGRFLVEVGWGVSPSQTVFEQDHGSRAVLAASQRRALADLKYVVAPWCLLSEARVRGGRPEDAKVAAVALGAALNVSGIDVTHPDVEISVDVGRRPGLLSFDPPTTSVEAAESFAEAFNFEAQTARRRQAHASGHEYLSQAKDAGAVLTVRLVDTQDARMLVAVCPTEVDLWLEGLEQLTPEFRHRVNLAGGLFIALSEALLEVDWTRGMLLWRALSSVLRTRYLGRAGVSELRHMLFRLQDNPGVEELRRQLYALENNANDSSYVDLVMCALLNGRRDWIQARVDEDAASGVAWRQKRAIALAGLLQERSADAAVWPTGPGVGHWGLLKRRADDWTNRQAFARHWWLTFLSATSASDAYAAWQMFLECADRRVLTWLKSDLEQLRRKDELWRRKLIHSDINWSNLQSAMRDAESKGQKALNSHLFGWSSPENWFEPSQLRALGA